MAETCMAAPPSSWTLPPSSPRAGPGSTIPAPVSRRQLGSTERWDQIVEVAEVLTKAGGAVIAIYEGHDIVMSDPEGNELCIL
jgi:hypothetical protein